MAIKKSDLYSSIWASCDLLRGGMDASQYKDYILTMLFMKYVSDKASMLSLANSVSVATRGRRISTALLDRTSGRRASWA